MAIKRPATIEEYIEAAPPVARPHLRAMNRILQAVAPDGTGVIKWNVPVFWERRVLFGFVAYKAHVSFGPGPATIKHFAKELGPYKTGHGTVQFPYANPCPKTLFASWRHTA
jgi:uncharacterized protein YdhG (YjbR/CyaY superfamily)